MKKRLLTLTLLLALPLLLLGQSDISQTLANVASSWRLATGVSDTITTGQYGIGWADDLMTVQTPVAALQFDETGDPAEPVMIWPGRIVANHIDVTSLSLFATVPTTSTSTGEAGQMAYDANYFYVCIASNTWKRTALSTW
jgi:hypothetical protein